MFRRLPDVVGMPVEVLIDGRPHNARSGDSAAAAILQAGLIRSRTTPGSAAPRLPYCMMGVCFDCLVMIDGVGNRQACLVSIRPGMRIDTQNGRRTLER